MDDELAPSQSAAAETPIHRHFHGLLVPSIIGLAGVLAYVEEHASNAAYTDYFDLPYVHVNPQQAAVPFALAAIAVVLVLWLGVNAGRLVYGLAHPLVLLSVVIIMGALPPYGWRQTGERVALTAALGGVAWLVGRARQRLKVPVPRVLAHPRVRPAIAHLDTAMTSWPLRRIALPLCMLVLTAVAVLGAGLLGNWFGRGHAADQVEFNVVSRDPVAGTVTVVFIDGDRLVEKILVTKSRTWLPQTTIRPVPVDGVRFERADLGPTKRAAATDG